MDRPTAQSPARVPTPRSSGVLDRQVSRVRRVLDGSHHHVLAQMIRYGMVSAIALAVDLAVLVLCVEVFGLRPVLAASISFACGIVVNFLCTRSWVFAHKQHDQRRVEFGLFLLVGITGLGLNALIIWLLDDVVGLHYLPAKLVATAAVFFWNFFLRRQFVYG